MTDCSHRIATFPRNVIRAASFVWIACNVTACAGNEGHSSTDNHQTADTAAISIPNFMGENPLEFRIPAEWQVEHNDGLVTVASFAPPHRGLAEALPQVVVVTILPHRTELFDQGSASTVMLKNGSWIMGNKTTPFSEAIFYVSNSAQLSVIGAYTNSIPLGAADIETIQSICESIVLSK